MGDEIAVVTRTPTSGPESRDFIVLRRPSPLEFIRWTRWSDVVLHQNLSLRGLWPLLLVRRPLVVAHHSWYRRVDGRIGVQDRLKRAVARRASGSIAVSPAIAERVGGPTVVVENGYRSDLFRTDSRTTRNLDLLFVGRLVSDKGVDILLRALADLGDLGVRPGLTIVGDGPEAGPLRELVARLKLGEQVRFTGQVVGEELAEVYRSHEILVVPSRYDEPFGIVALEGIASGCIVVGSRGGGLPAAIGPCGALFDNGDVQGLTRLLEQLLSDEDLRTRMRRGARAHLEGHGLRVMTESYRRILHAAGGQQAR